ncbi:MAG: CDP-alcohol phosphatidyltransferase family protein [Rhabdochlamydiaceae bacterium]|nr:CDP-alcohol phosphatidyltransferase family protein [Rhabdochlamydiaceae bacterium]
MLSLSNTLSLLRAPLALLLLIDNTIVRVIAIFLAMCSDCLDGYLARKRHTASQLGAVLDPAMDKFFVYFALILFLSEHKILLWQACAMISRDFFLCLFALYLSCFHRWKSHKYRSIRWGKVSTALQFLSLMALAAGFQIPNFVFIIFIGTGVLAFIELFRVRMPYQNK